MAALGRRGFRLQLLFCLGRRQQLVLEERGPWQPQQARPPTSNAPAGHQSATVTAAAGAECPEQPQPRATDDNAPEADQQPAEPPAETVERAAAAAQPHAAVLREEEDRGAGATAASIPAAPARRQLLAGQAKVP